jgi:hypothetical protein
LLFVFLIFTIFREFSEREREGGREIGGGEGE